MIYYSLLLLSFISKTNFGFGQKMNSVSDDPKFFFKHFNWKASIFFPLAHLKKADILI